MKHSQLKDLIREIKKTLGRFLSITLIVAIGIAFYAGINAGAPAMKNTADTYYDDTNFQDFRIISTLGLTINDLEDIKQIDNISQVQAIYTVEASVNKNNSEMIYKVYSYDLNNENEDYLNQLVIVEGRLPKNNNECVIEESKLLDTGFKVGDTITLDTFSNNINDTLKQNEYKIVGTVQNANYLSHEKGSTIDGTRKIDFYMYVPTANFINQDIISEILVTVDNAKHLDTYSSEYFDYIKPVEDKLISLGITNVNNRLDNIKQEALDKIELAQKELDTNKNNVLKQLEMSKLELDNSQLELDKALSIYEISYNELINSNIPEQQKLIALEQLNEQKIILDTNQEKINLGLVELNTNKEIVIDKFNTSQEEINKNIEDINNMEAGEWYILDRNSHYSFKEYESAANNMKAIAQVFPVFFFLVAGLVCLTTMSRMVDEQRSYIGTMKALGYSNTSISLKYIIYAMIASITGSILGLCVGLVVFPIVIFNAWNIMYTLPSVKLVVDPILVIVSSLLAIGLTSLVAYVSCRSSLKSTAAQLMRPKAPKEGKKILLERIPFIWKRLSFTYKVTARNLFRYKKRFLMSILGIAGCTALLLTGFGIRDSISGVVGMQYGDIIKYQTIIKYDDKLNSNQIEEINKQISNYDEVSNILEVYVQGTSIKSNENDIGASIIVSSNQDKLNDFYTLRTRSNNETITLTNNGIVISEKLATLLDKQVNDKITLNINNKEIEVNIDAINENYIEHYIFMSEEYYLSNVDNSINYNSLYINTNEGIDETILENKLSNIEEISSILFLSTIAETFNNTISSLNIIVLVLIISAGLLAFVVLYNLTTVNISERLREIATIKVLGFYDKEVQSYVYKENILLSIIGSMLGLILGIGLHEMVMALAEMDSVMFGRNINILSYILSFIITMLFTFIVNYTMNKKLSNIEMVESLKSVE